MSQMAKTGIYIAVAAVVSLLAYISRPQPATFQRDELVGKPIFANFADPSGAKSLRIVRYDEDVAQLDTFEVRQVGGRWVLPSHSNYPADAENRIRDAASEFVGLEFVGVVPNDGADLGVYGVLEPNEENQQRAAKGVGTLLEMQDAEGTKHQLIVGNPVQGEENQYYVRPPQHNGVYIANIDMTKFPQDFEEWINPNLLDINSWDIKEIVLKDYSFQVLATTDGRLRPDYQQRLQVTVHEESGEWKLDDLQEFRDGRLQPSQLAEGEVLNTERLNALRDALSDLTIVDVQRKPEGLKEDLTAEQDVLSDGENVQSLIDKGFYPVQVGDNQTVELLSSDGEVLVRMNNGVEYVLRFGQVAGSEKGSEDAGEETKLNRYLFVSARVNPDLIPPPELEPLPEQPAPDAGTSNAAETPEPAETADAAASAADAAAPADAPETADTAEPADPAESPAAPTPSDSEAPETSAVPEGAETAEAGETSEEPDASQPQTEASESGEQAEGSETSEAAEQTAGSETSEASELSEAAEQPEASTGSGTPDADALQQERQRIVRDNKRKQDAYDEKLAQAETKKNELNYRFAEWYYVIPEGVFKKIHLSRADLIQVDPKAEGFGVGDLRELQGGIEPPAPDAPATPPLP